MDSDSEEENPDWNRFWGYNPSPSDPHEYEWRKEQARMVVEGKKKLRRDWVKR